MSDQPPDTFIPVQLRAIFGPTPRPTPLVRVVVDGVVDIETCDENKARARVADYNGNAVIERLYVTEEWRPDA